jgi:hypothetical protein
MAKKLNRVLNRAPFPLIEMLKIFPPTVDDMGYLFLGGFFK